MELLCSDGFCSSNSGSVGNLSNNEQFELATRLRGPQGASLAEVLSFLCGPGFKGKLQHAQELANPPFGVPGVLVITPGDGLKTPLERMTVEKLRCWAALPAEGSTSSLRRLLKDAISISEAIGIDCDRCPRCEVVLLGSSGSRHRNILAEVFDDHLQLPGEVPGYLVRQERSLVLAGDDRQENKKVAAANSANTRRLHSA
jgi:hypothetical protein